MKRSTSKRTMAVLMMPVLLFALLVLPNEATAKSPYKGYTYSQSEETPISINGYLYRDSIDGYDWDAGPLKEPEDLFIAGDDTIYVVDGGNNRVVHFDKSKRLLGIYGDPEGKGQLNGPKGIYVTDKGKVYVADTLTGTAGSSRNSASRKARCSARISCIRRPSSLSINGIICSS